MVLPEDEDPDSFLNKRGLQAFLDLLDLAVPMFDFYLDLKTREAGNRIERQVEVLQEMIPLLLNLRNMVQRALYVKRLSERMGIAESWVQAEIQKALTRPERGRDAERLRENLPGSSLGKADDRLLLHLFVHHPNVIDQLVEKNLKVLVSDMTVLRILDLMVQDYRKEHEMFPERILESLGAEPAADLLREAMLSPPIYRPEEIPQALKEFEDKVHRMKISESKQKAFGNLEEANKIPKLIKKRWG
jgi:DNA primase